MKIEDVMEIYDIQFLAIQSKRTPAQVTKKRNFNVIVALSCSALIHIGGGYFFLHMPRHVPSIRLRSLEVSAIITSPPKGTVPLLTPRVPNVAKPISSPPRVTRVPESAPVPVKGTQTAPVAERAAPAQVVERAAPAQVAERAAPAPGLKSVTDRPLPALTAAASRETAPAVPQTLSQPPVPHAQAYGAPGRTRVEAQVSKDGGEGQPVSGPSYAAAYLRNPAPKYPAAARRLRLQGTATVRVLVSAEGRPLAVTLQETSGTRALDEAALEAVRHWSFVPARRGSRPVAAEVDVPLRFTLK